MASLGIACGRTWALRGLFSKRLGPRSSIARRASPLQQKVVGHLQSHRQFSSSRFSRQQIVQQQAEQTQSIRSPRRRRPWRILLGAAAILSLGYAIGKTSGRGPPWGLLLDLRSGERTTYTGPEELEKRLWSNPLVQSLSKDPSYIMTRPNQTLPESFRKDSLTANTLLGPGKFDIPAIVFTKPDGSEGIAIHYCGAQMCGWPGFVHGGLIATILDEGLARTCFHVLPNKVGMTANLQINYRFPCKAEQFVVLRSQTTGNEGRKAWAKGELYELTYAGENGKLIADAQALFVQPKGAGKLLGRANEQLNKMSEVKR